MLYLFVFLGASNPEGLLTYAAPKMHSKLSHRQLDILTRDFAPITCSMVFCHVCLSKIQYCPSSLSFVLDILLGRFSSNLFVYLQLSLKPVTVIMARAWFNPKTAGRGLPPYVTVSENVLGPSSLTNFTFPFRSYSFRRIRRFESLILAPNTNTLLAAWSLKALLPLLSTVATPEDSQNRSSTLHSSPSFAVRYPPVLQPLGLSNVSQSSLIPHPQHLAHRLYL